MDDGMMWATTALGDSVTLTQRLSSAAEAGQAMYSDDTVRDAGIDTPGFRRTGARRPERHRPADRSVVRAPAAPAAIGA
jgi:class 3 adenylate cyclase